MSSKHFPVAEPWSAEVQRQYILDAYEYYKKKHGDPRAPAVYGYEQHQPRDLALGHQKRLDTLSLLYRLGRGGGQLRISYKEFEKRVLHGEHTPHCRYRNHHRERIRYCSCQRDEYQHWYPRGGAHYRQKVPINYKAKERDPASEEQKRQKKEWREKKGFHRSRTRDGSWRRGCRARGFSRVVGNRALRRWEQKMIKAENWEALGDEERLMRLFLDPWDWD